MRVVVVQDVVERRGRALIDDIRLEFPDLNSAQKRCHSVKNQMCQVRSAAHNHYKIVIKFVCTLDIYINVAYIKNMPIMQLMSSKPLVPDQYTQFIRFARCCTNNEPQKLLLTYV